MSYNEMAGEVAESTPRRSCLFFKLTMAKAEEQEPPNNQDLGNCLLSSYFWQTHNNRLKTNDFVHPG